MDAKARPRGKKTVPMAVNNELFDRSTLRERRRQAIIPKVNLGLFCGCLWHPGALVGARMS